MHRHTPGLGGDQAGGQHEQDGANRATGITRVDEPTTKQRPITAALLIDHLDTSRTVDDQHTLLQEKDLGRSQFSLHGTGATDGAFIDSHLRRDEHHEIDWTGHAVINPTNDAIRDDRHGCSEEQTSAQCLREFIAGQQGRHQCRTGEARRMH